MSSPVQTIANWLKHASASLMQAGDSTAYLDGLVMLEDIYGKDRSWLLAHTESIISLPKLMKLNEMIIRRQNHEPLAYIRNKTEFYGRNFYIDNRVLEPRPESETIIDMLKGLDLPGQTTIIDIGTGSGALAITAKLEIPHSKVVATDIDSRCLIVARKNIRKYGLDIQVFKGPLLDPLPVRQFAGNKTVLICNLPYVPDSFKLNLAALNEPKLAIFGGLDGLEVYQKLFEQCTELKFRPKFILTESMPPQHKKLSAIAAVNGFRLAKTNDFIQLFS